MRSVVELTKLVWVNVVWERENNGKVIVHVEKGMRAELNHSNATDNDLNRKFTVSEKNSISP